MTGPRQAGSVPVEEIQHLLPLRQGWNRAALAGGERADRVGEAAQLAQARFVMKDIRLG